MTDAHLRFTREEYAERIRRTRAAMEVLGYEVMIVSDPSNMHWLTGYDGWSFYVHQAVILPLEGEPLWWGRPMDAVGAQKTTWLSDDSIHSYPDHYVQNRTQHPYSQLAEIFRERGWDSARIGVEKDNYYFSGACLEVLNAELPYSTLFDGTGLVNWRRAVKSPTELDYMRKAARIVEAMHARIREKTEPGIRKCDLVAEIYDAALRGTEDFGGDYPAIVPLLPSGPEAAAAHLTWNDQPLQSGQGTFFEIAGVYRRYHCPLSRTIFLGQPPTEMLETEKAVLEGVEAGLEVAKPGNTCEMIAGAFFGVLRKHGIEKNSRTGYSIGCSYPPDWGERTMSLRAGDQTVLEENMTFHFMPAIWSDDWGLELTESIVIRPNGPELLAKVPRELVVKA